MEILYKKINEIQKITDPDKMQKIMTEKIKRKFTEVYDTPTMRMPFLEILGFDGLTKNAKSILRDNFVLPPVIHLDIIEFSSI